VHAAPDGFVMRSWSAAGGWWESAVFDRAMAVFAAREAPANVLIYAVRQDGDETHKALVPRDRLKEDV